MTLPNKVAQFSADSDTVNSWLNGPATGPGSVLVTAGGLLRTPAKLIADKDNDINVLSQTVAASVVATTALVTATSQAVVSTSQAIVSTTNSFTATTQAGLATTARTAAEAARDVALVYGVAKVDLAAPGGAGLVGAIGAGVGSVLRTLQDKVQDTATPKDKGALVNNSANDYAALQNAATDGDVALNSGISLIKTGLLFTQPVYFRGRGARSIINIAADFVSTGDAFTISPAAGTEKRNWGFENFRVSNAGTAAKNVFQIDLAAAGKFLNKLSIKNVVADAVTGKFVELLNPTNLDGLFSSVFEDNFSLNGYYLDNIGDSVIAQRNTVSGVGVAFYVNQLPTASHLLIRDCNITSAGGALYSVNSLNLLFDNNQVEVTPTFTGAANAAVALAGPAGTIKHQNARITGNNINTQLNAGLICVSVDCVNGAKLEGNTLFCNPTTGAHINIGPNAQDVYIGPNKYYSSVNGVEIGAIVNDAGSGTMGLWKNATLTTTWTLVDPANGFLVGFFKTVDGQVLLRGNLVGLSTASAMPLFTLPVGFRPKLKVVTMYLSNSAAANVAVQIEPNGVVTLLTSGVNYVYLDGVTFSAR